MAAVDDYMKEVCVYGGLLATRAEVYADLDRPGLSWLMVDRLVGMCLPATPADIATRNRLADIRRGKNDL